MKSKSIAQAYKLARERYAALGVDTDRALANLARIPISMHCWQGDDVGGFDGTGGTLGDGIAVTGNYLGRARTAGQRDSAERGRENDVGLHGEILFLSRS